MTQMSLSLVDQLVHASSARRTRSPGAADPGRTRTISGTRWSAAALDAAIACVLATVAVSVAALPVLVAALAALTWPVLLLAMGHYRCRPLGETVSARLARPLLAGLKVAVISLAAVPWFAGRTEPVDLALLVGAFGVATMATALAGVAQRRPRVVLAGHPLDVREAMAEMIAVGRHELVAVCLTRQSSRPFGTLPVHIGLAQAAAVAEQHTADALVVLPGPHLPPTAMRRLHWAVADVGTQLYLGTGLLDVAPTRTHMISAAGLDMLHVEPATLAGPRRYLKDVAERLAAAVGLVVVSPILLVLAVLVRLDSTGPVLFRQERVGRNGRLFTMLKYRSMCTSAESDRTGLVASNEADGVLFKIQQDPRVTRVGRWLRRYSLDELPQLWNVVRGEMSLVGPRPALPAEVAAYEVDPRRRLVVKPGLTGLWQVSGRSDLTWDESVRLDLRYVENWSLRLDAQILLRTVRAVLGHRGAY